MRRGGCPCGAGLLQPPCEADSQDTVQFPLGLSLHPEHHRGLVFSCLQLREVLPEQILHVRDAEVLQCTASSLLILTFPALQHGKEQQRSRNLPAALWDSGKERC